MKAKAKLTLLLTTIVAFLITGCRTSVSLNPIYGQEQTAVYQAGYFYAPIEADSDRVFNVAIRALDNMGILRTGEIHGDDHVTIYGRKVGDEKVIVRVRQVAPGESELRIRVTFLGDLPKSQMIYAKIRDEL